MIRLHRRKTYAEFEPNRGDQGAGFFLGAVKAAVIAVFARRRHPVVCPSVHQGRRLGRRTGAALLAPWLLPNSTSRPTRSGTAPPVQAFVAQIRHEGLGENLPEIKTPEPSELMEQAITSSSTLENLAPTLEPAASEPSSTPSTASTDDARRPLQITKPLKIDPNLPAFPE